MIPLRILLTIFFFSYVFCFHPPNYRYTSQTRIFLDSSHGIMTFSNSSSRIETVQLHSSSNTYLLSITLTSHLDLQNAELLFPHLTVPLICAGVLSLDRFRISEPQNHKQISTLVETNDITTSSVTMRDTNLSDLSLYEHFGTLLSSGASKLQTVINCRFYNLTTSVSRTPMSIKTDVDTSILCDSTVSLSEDAIYGRIVSGFSYKSVNSFTCSNSTFVNCFSTRRPLINSCSSPISKDPHDPEDASDPDERHECEIESRVELKRTFNFTKVTFTCTATENGGALYLDLTTPSTIVIIEESKFQACKTTAEGKHGGAIYAAFPSGLSTLTIKKSTFTNCEAKGDGGAIYATFPSGSSSATVRVTVTESLFKQNTATGCGGAIYASFSSRLSSTPLFTVSQSPFEGCRCTGSNAGEYTLDTPPENIGGTIYLKSTGTDTLTMTSGNKIDEEQFNKACAQFDSCTFKNLTSASTNKPYDPQYLGAGIVSVSASASIKNCTFTDEVSNIIPLLYAEESAIRIETSSFTGKTPADLTEGTGESSSKVLPSTLYYSFKSYSLITGTNFKNTQNGAIILNAGHAKITDSSITECPYLYSGCKIEGANDGDPEEVKSKKKYKTMELMNYAKIELSKCTFGQKDSDDEDPMWIYWKRNDLTQAAESLQAGERSNAFLSFDFDLKAKQPSDVVFYNTKTIKDDCQFLTTLSEADTDDRHYTTFNYPRPYISVDLSKQQRIVAVPAQSEGNSFNAHPHIEFELEDFQPITPTALLTWFTDNEKALIRDIQVITNDEEKSYMIMLDEWIVQSAGGHFRLSVSNNNVTFSGQMIVLFTHSFDSAALAQNITRTFTFLLLVVFIIISVIFALVALCGCFTHLGSKSKKRSQAQDAMMQQGMMYPPGMMMMPQGQMMPVNGQQVMMMNPGAPGYSAYRTPRGVEMQPMDGAASSSIVASSGQR